MTPPCWLSGQVSTLRETDPGSNPAFVVDFLPGRIIPVTLKMVLQWLPCQVPGVIGSALRLVGLASAFYDLVR